MERETKVAHEHVKEMVRIANTLINESINKSNPILAPQRTLSTEQFQAQYTEHYRALYDIMSRIGLREEHEFIPDIDEQIQTEREELKQLVAKLENKLGKLDHLRFWMDNMVFDKTAPSTD